MSCICCIISGLIIPVRGPIAGIPCGPFCIISMCCRRMSCIRCSISAWVIGAAGAGIAACVCSAGEAGTSFPAMATWPAIATVIAAASINFLVFTFPLRGVELFDGIPVHPAPARLS